MNLRNLTIEPVPAGKALLTIAFAGAFSTAFTYFIMKKAFDVESEIRVITKIEEVKRQYGTNKPKNPVELVNDLVKYDDETVDLVLNEAGYAKISDVKEFYTDRITTTITVVGDREAYTEEELEVIQEVEGLTQISKNVFTNADVEEDDEWDMIYEIENRDLDKPFIIHVSEFEEESELEKVRLTYYDGDDVLADERNTMIPNPAKYIGEDLRWGHGSNDPNIVYIRNLFLDADFEVTRMDGEYHETVRGYIQHEDTRRRVSKHRVYDD